MEPIIITEFHESQNGVCDVCRRKAKTAVSLRLPSMYYEYVCEKCTFSLVSAVAKATVKKSSQPTITKAS